MRALRQYIVKQQAQTENLPNHHQGMIVCKTENCSENHVRLTLKLHEIDSESGKCLVKALGFPQSHMRLTVNRMRSQSIACDF